MYEVNEQSSASLVLTFRDQTGAVSPPNSVSYSVTDVPTGSVIRSSSPVSTGETVTVVLDSQDTAMVTSSQGRENHVVTVIGEYGGNDRATAEFIFTVVNLTGI